MDLQRTVIHPQAVQLRIENPPVHQFRGATYCKYIPIIYKREIYFPILLNLNPRSKDKEINATQDEFIVYDIASTLREYIVHAPSYRSEELYITFGDNLSHLIERLENRKRKMYEELIQIATSRPLELNPNTAYIVKKIESIDPKAYHLAPNITIYPASDEELLYLKFNPLTH